MPNYWPDPKTGIGYQVQVEIPYQIMDSIDRIETVPIQRAGLDRQILLRDVATVSEGTMPGEFDRYNMKRSVNLTANIAGEDLGRVAGRVRAGDRAAGAPPKGATVEIRGQIRPMDEILQGLAIGLGMSIVVILLLLTANFQSVKLAAGRRLDRAGRGGRRGRDAVADRARRSTFSRSWGRSWPSASRSPTRFCWSPSPRRTAASKVTWRTRPPSRARQGRLRPILMTSLRHDGRHGADGRGLERGRRADGPAGPGGHRRPGRGDRRDADRAADRLRAGPGLGRTGICIARSRRSGEPALPRRGAGGVSAHADLANGEPLAVPVSITVAGPESSELARVETSR